MMSITSRGLILIIKMASVSLSGYSGRPTFSDLVGPVRLYRKDRFTSKIVYYFYRANMCVCQVQFYEKSVSFRKRSFIHTV